MAGLIGLQAADIEIQDALRLAKWDYEGAWVPHPVVRLTTTLPVGVIKDGVRTGVRARWGFPVGPGRPIGNARDDKLTESPMWKSMLGRSHCLVVSTGIYEQAEVDGVKRSLWFRRVDGRPIIMPGLAGLRKFDGEDRLCCAIITTTPNPFFGQFHDRQVCSLDAQGVESWLEADRDTALGMLRAAAPADWEAVVVDDRIFKHGRREDDDLVPIEAPRRWDPAHLARPGSAIPSKATASGSAGPRKPGQAKLGV